MIKYKGNLFFYKKKYKINWSKEYNNPMRLIFCIPFNSYLHLSTSSHDWYGTGEAQRRGWWASRGDNGSHLTVTPLFKGSPANKLHHHHKSPVNPRIFAKEKHFLPLCYGSCLHSAKVFKYRPLSVFFFFFFFFGITFSHLSSPTNHRRLDLTPAISPTAMKAATLRSLPFSHHSTDFASLLSSFHQTPSFPTSHLKKKQAVISVTPTRSSSKSPSISSMFPF